MKRKSAKRSLADASVVTAKPSIDTVNTPRSSDAGFFAGLTPSLSPDRLNQAQYKKSGIGNRESGIGNRESLT
ncbi:hypothetical protein [Moorena sp. SIO3I6]|uniref:hypothetical protein n=1 Tax=Moorena sp. SIO3I6 TaxID=2607831 RepID=UPI0013F70DCA|nr:hypothetical protein [Moorena sp. SIO3I6]NEP27435.1 hypothetical protein [Moorena sp. SIO3I6]